MPTFMMSASWLAPLIQAVEAYGVDPQLLLADEIRGPDLETPGTAQLSYDKISRLWKRAVALTNEPAIGLIAAKYIAPSTFGPLSFAMYASRDALTALNTYAECSGIGSNVAVWRLRQSDEYVELVREGRAGTGAEEIKDAVAAALLNICKGLGNPVLRPSRLVLGRKAPRDISQWTAHFNIVPKFREGGGTILRFSTDHVTIKNPSYEPEVYEVCRALLDKRLQEVKSSSFIGIVNAQIIKSMESGDLHIDTVAKSLALSRRTLQRRLWNEAHATFGELVKTIRQSRAEHYLANSDRSIEEISFLLCYCSVSSFSRSFRKVNGKSPSDFRRSAQSSHNERVDALSHANNQPAAP